MSENTDRITDPRQRFDEVTPYEFYRDIFPEGELDVAGAMTKGKYTAIAITVSSTETVSVERKDGTTREKPLTRRYTITDDLERINEIVSGDDFAIMAPLSYAGRKRSADNARMLYGLVFDLDGIIIKDGFAQGLESFWYGHVIAAERLPMPTYIVASGTGVHLYYIFEAPLPLFDNIRSQLQKYKHELTEMIWNESITTLGEDRKDVQQEGIFQAFRMPGSITKNGQRTRAFRTGEKVGMHYMNGFVFSEFQVTEFTYKSELTRREAAEKYPEWYEERIVKGKKGVIHPWRVNRRLYDWWKKEIFNKARVGHRYYCLMTLAIFAMKCSFPDPKKNPNPVTRDELEADCYELMEVFDKLTVDPKNRFDIIDVQDALEAFEDPYITYPRNSIAYKSGIEIKANVRKGNTQEEHLKIARFTKDLKKQSGRMNPEGRPSKEQLVFEYFRDHPNATNMQAANDLQISRSTVVKYHKATEIPKKDEKALKIENTASDGYVVEVDKVNSERERRMEYYQRLMNGEFGPAYQVNVSDEFLEGKVPKKIPEEKAKRIMDVFVKKEMEKRGKKG